jgi:hypothetical protein
VSTVHKSSSVIVWDAPPGDVVSYNVRVILPGQDPITVGPQSEKNPAVENIDASVLFDVVPAGNYEVVVRAKDSVGDFGPYSAPLAVTLILGPAAPDNLQVV